MAPFALVRSLKRQHASQALGVAALTIAAATLIGWWGGLPMLSSWGSGFATTKPVAALCLMALGLALVDPGKNSRFALAIGLPVRPWCSARRNFRNQAGQAADRVQHKAGITADLAARRFGQHGAAEAEFGGLFQP